MCAHNSVNNALKSKSLRSPVVAPGGMFDKELSEKLVHGAVGKPAFKMPDYAYVHR